MDLGGIEPGTPRMTGKVTLTITPHELIPNRSI